jgi:hypothetical protein
MIELIRFLVALKRIKKRMAEHAVDFEKILLHPLFERALHLYFLKVLSLERLVEDSAYINKNCNFIYSRGLLA